MIFVATVLCTEFK